VSNPSRDSSGATKVRFAPSPTGALHIGGARTALYNWLVARGAGGSLVLRIEDTDRERSTEANVAQILDALEWLELDYDEGPVSQYQRADRHRERIASLLDAGLAYRDTATGDDVRAFRKESPGRGYRGEPSDGAEAAVRLRVPDEGETIVHDLIRGDIAFENRVLDDPVIARSDGSALYNFAVAVDDAEMGITEVIRGDDHLSNTPKQLLALDAMGFEAPRYAHLPLLHGPDGKKLSKRHGAASVQELRESGYLPAAVRNYLALLGWGTQDDTTLMSTGELIERFDISRVGRASAVFDERKLRWINGRYMREESLEAYEKQLVAHLSRTDPKAAEEFAAATPERRRRACEIVQEKAQAMNEVWPLIAFLFSDPEPDEKAWKKVMKPRVLEPLTSGLEALEDLDSWSLDSIEGSLREVMERESVGAGKVLQPIRVAITGTSVSPGIFESLEVLGRETSLGRLQSAVQRLQSTVAEPETGRGGQAGTASG
jgi:glutamyl-tRNA synthetase